MQIICNFCDLTKLPVKKYMNIYLNIFKTLYQKKDRHVIEKFKIKDCLIIISSYFHKANMITKEEKENFLNDLKINSSEISSIPESNDFKDYIQEYGKIFKINKNFHSSNPENSLKRKESIHLGEYENNAFDFDIESIEDLFKLNELNAQIKKFIPKTPTLLYYSTKKY